MSTNPNTIKSQDAGSIHITNVTDRTKSMVELVDKVERLTKQLDIAVKVLKEYADRNNWYNTYKPNSLDECPIASKERWKKEYGYRRAEKVLKKIEELKNDL